jgi:glutaredoxin 3
MLSMTNKKVEIYSTANCHFCHMAKEFFAANGIAFTDYNVGLDTEKRTEMVEMTGQMGVPVIVIDGKDAVIGFDQKALSKLLELPA